LERRETDPVEQTIYVNDLSRSLNMFKSTNKKIIQIGAIRRGTSGNGVSLM